MKIRRVDIDAVNVRNGSSWIFVQVCTDDGLEGWGELNPSAPRRACIDEVERIATYALGKDPRQVEAFCAGLGPATLSRLGVHAMAALEQALWDLLGQSVGALGLPVVGGQVP